MLIFFFLFFAREKGYFVKISIAKFEFKGKNSNHKLSSRGGEGPLVSRTWKNKEKYIHPQKSSDYTRFSICNTCIEKNKKKLFELSFEYGEILVLSKYMKLFFEGVFHPIQNIQCRWKRGTYIYMVIPPPSDFASSSKKERERKRDRR